MSVYGPRMFSFAKILENQKKRDSPVLSPFPMILLYARCPIIINTQSKILYHRVSQSKSIILTII